MIKFSVTDLQGTGLSGLQTAVKFNGEVLFVREVIGGFIIEYVKQSLV